MSADNATLHTWDAMEAEAITPFFDRKMIWGERIMMAHLNLKKGCVVPTHHHDNEQFSYIVSGEMRFWVGEDEKEVIVRGGQVLQLPSHILHGAEATEDTFAIDIFCPPRQDWIEKTDDYLRSQK